MKIKEIKTLQDYEKALKLIEELWESSNEMDLSELEQLVDLVEEYEQYNCSMN